MATRFVLSVRPDGKAVLTCRDQLTSAQAQELRDAVRGWQDGRWPILVIQDCDTVHVDAFELELGPSAHEAAA